MSHQFLAPRHALGCWGAGSYVRSGGSPLGAASRQREPALSSATQRLGPKGLEFGRYSIEYHILRNYLFVSRHMGPERAARHMPESAKRIVAAYDSDGAISDRRAPAPSPPAQGR